MLSCPGCGKRVFYRVTAGGEGIEVGELVICGCGVLLRFGSEKVLELPGADSWKEIPEDTMKVLELLEIRVRARERV